MEPRVPGYKGYLPGRQHIYGRTYGMASSALGAEHMRNSEDKNAFLGAAALRCAHAHTREESHSSHLARGRGRLAGSNYVRCDHAPAHLTTVQASATRAPAART